MNKTLQNLLACCIREKQDITIRNVAAALGISEGNAGKYLSNLWKAGWLKVTPVSVKIRHYDLLAPENRLAGQRYLIVYKKEHLSGYLYFSEGKHHFFYDLNYLCAEDAQPLSPVLELQTQVFSAEKLFPAFSQILPEGKDRKLLERKAETANDIDLLLWLNQIYGDLHFIRGEEKKTYRAKTVIEPHYKTVKRKILGSHDFPNILNLKIQINPDVLFPDNSSLIQSVQAYAPSGLSGFQHKLSVVLDADVLREAKENETSCFFMKPYNKQKADPCSEFYFPHLALNEHLFMTFAKNELGFDVPWSGVVKREQDKEYSYVVKRFDRYQGCKFSHDEFAALIGLDSDTKYNISSERLCKKIKPYLTEEADRLIFLQYYFYSMVIVHEDMHTKNLSVITEDGEIHMAPLYDIATTAIYQNTCGYESHLFIGNKRKNIRPGHFQGLVDILNVNKEKFKCAAARILSKYTDCLPAYIDKLADFRETEIFKRTRANLSGRPQRITDSSTLKEALENAHKKRVKSLKKTGWYEHLSNV
ncbi:MAG: type II toxin-antitoxin system HipA family toxin [Gammaproteobacteria bacterium]|nr:type II toxin-antitoxin system HipA family toxin [Gammaproteobacteria bacterium]